MRIVSGSLKGRRFSPPPSFRARPTTDMAKENLFNVLNNTLDFESTVVLDLFSGTGSISYEFASRGCPSVTSVEKDFHHYSFIRKCIEELELSKSVKPLKADVFTYLSRLKGETFDLIFADPPFELSNLEEIPDIIFARNVLKPDGLLILEHGPSHDFSHHPAFTQTRHYGKVCFTFFNALSE
jgi:16S rRNA (guanine966-N2)-methyltransferase